MDAPMPNMMMSFTPPSGLTLLSHFSVESGRIMLNRVLAWTWAEEPPPSSAGCSAIRLARGATVGPRATERKEASDSIKQFHSSCAENIPLGFCSVVYTARSRILAAFSNFTPVLTTWSKFQIAFLPTETVQLSISINHAQLTYRN